MIINTSNKMYDTATQTSDGLMSAQDKINADTVFGSDGSNVGFLESFMKIMGGGNVTALPDGTDLNNIENGVYQLKPKLSYLNRPPRDMWSGPHNIEILGNKLLIQCNMPFTTMGSLHVYNSVTGVSHMNSGEIEMYDICDQFVIGENCIHYRRQQYTASEQDVGLGITNNTTKWSNWKQIEWISSSSHDISFHLKGFKTYSSNITGPSGVISLMQQATYFNGFGYLVGPGGAFELSLLNSTTVEGWSGPPYLGILSGTITPGTYYYEAWI